LKTKTLTIVLVILIIALVLIIVPPPPWIKKLIFKEEYSPPERAQEEIPWFFTDPRLNRTANLSLPINIEDLADDPSLGPIGPWGVHGGNHPEGFDHTSFIFTKKAPIYAPDYGIVVEIEERHKDDIKLIIFHNYTIATWWDHFGEVLVSVNDTVEKGEIIGYARYYEEREVYLIDWGVVDFNNDTGTLFTRYREYKNGSMVPPFDYISKAERDAIYQKFNETMLQPFLRGEFVPFMTKAEHNLVNPIFPERMSEDDIAGVWVYNGYWEPNGYPEILTFIHRNTKYFGEVFHAVYADFLNIWYFDTWDATYEVDTNVTPHRIKIIFDYGGPNGVRVLCGIYEIDTSGDRLKLRIEFRNDTYPTSFTENAAIYLMRTRDSPLSDAKFRSSNTYTTQMLKRNNILKSYQPYGFKLNNVNTFKCILITAEYKQTNIRKTKSLTTNN